jgi:hypothetical protein
VVLLSRDLDSSLLILEHFFRPEILLLNGISVKKINNIQKKSCWVPLFQKQRLGVFCNVQSIGGSAKYLSVLSQQGVLPFCNKLCPFLSFNLLYSNKTKGSNQPTQIFFFFFSVNLSVFLFLLNY